ncbi:MAG: CdaR family protein [Mariprofundaceae bacterium]|nr:CdaR family protein [Mariprofundaceae bacterium]
MHKFFNILKSLSLYVWAMLIAVILWMQVHGEGEGSLSMDVALQVQGLPENMVIVNNLPNQVRLTVKGLQARLKVLQSADVFVPLDARDLSSPGVSDRPLIPNDIHLPAGLTVESIQPDFVQLQVDRIITRAVTVQPQFNLPKGWHVQTFSVQPLQAHLQGPEVWLEPLDSVETTPLKLALKEGPFEIKATITTLVGKSIHLENNKIDFVVRGFLLKNITKPNIKNTLNDKNKQRKEQL